MVNFSLVGNCGLLETPDFIGQILVCANHVNTFYL